MKSYMFLEAVCLLILKTKKTLKNILFKGL